MFPQCFPVYHTGNIVSTVSFSKMEICLRYTAGNFSENPSMRAVAKILRARASGHWSNICEQFQQRAKFASTCKLNGTIQYPLICGSCRKETTGNMSTTRKTQQKTLWWEWKLWKRKKSKLKAAIARQLNELAGRIAGVNGVIEPRSLKEMVGIKVTLKRSETIN